MLDNNRNGANKIFSESRVAEKRKKVMAVIAKRTQLSKQTAPHFYISRLVTMAEAVKYRSEWLREQKRIKAPTFTSIIMRAAALAAADFQPFYSLFNDISEGDIHAINIGVVTKTEYGLAIPVIRSTNLKGLGVLSSELNSAIERARTGRLLSGDIAKKHMSISNAGMYGVDVLYPIIDLPDPLIIGVGSIRDNAVVTANGIESLPQMTLTLSVDHRKLDGADAGAFLSKIVDFLENKFELVGGDYGYKV